MSYTTTEREKIAENIRQFLKEDRKEKFEHQHFGGDPFLVKRVLPDDPIRQRDPGEYRTGC